MYSGHTPAGRPPAQRADTQAEFMQDPHSFPHSPLPAPSSLRNQACPVATAQNGNPLPMFLTKLYPLHTYEFSCSQATSKNITLDSAHPITQHINVSHLKVKGPYIYEHIKETQDVT